MTLTSKIDFAVIFMVKNANPNGDPLNGNRPRTTLEGLGELSDVCIKRKIRDRLSERGYEIFVQPKEKTTDGCATLFARAESTEIFKNNNEEDIRKAACNKWIDVRAFGQVFAFKGNQSKTAKREDEIGLNACSIGIRGPVSIHPALSITPVNVTSIQITKSVNNEGDPNKKSSDTMGMKHRVDKGIYVFYGSMSPQLAACTGFSDEDAEAIKSVLPRLFVNDSSSARPDGSMKVLKVIWWKHNSNNGQYSSARVHGSIEIKNDDKDFLKINELEGLQPLVIPGF